jgi:hypothetical protein
MNQMVSQSLAGVGFPIAFVLVAGALWFALFRRHARVRAIGIGWIVAGGIGLAYLLAFGGFTFPPRESGHWIPYLAGGAALIGCFQFWGLRPIWSLGISLFTAVVFFWAQLLGNLQVLLWVLAFTAVLFVSAILLQQIIEDRCSGAELSLGLALSAGAGGIGIFLGGSAVLGQISGTLGLVLGVVAVLAFVWNTTVGPIVPLIYVLIFGSLLLNGCLFAQLPWLTAVLLWIAPWALLFGQRADHPKVSRRLGSLCLRIIGVVTMVAIALVSAFLLAPPSSEM